MNSPKAPDPYATANAQTQSNQQTANYQSTLNDVNQITPYGSVNYSTNGTDPATGAPIRTATTSLSQPVQNLVDSNISNATGMSDLAGQLQSNVGQAISSGTPQAPTLQNLNLSPGALQSQMDTQARAQLDPQWASLSDQNDQQTYDRGLAPGSEGYANSQRAFDTARNSAYNSFYLGDQAQAANDLTAQNASQNQNAQAGFQNNLTAYNAPLNALSALQSGSQISQPGVGQTANAPPTSVAGTNVAGLIQQNYQNQLQQSNATMGGLFGLGGSALQLGAAFL